MSITNAITAKQIEAITECLTDINFHSEATAFELLGLKLKQNLLSSYNEAFIDYLINELEAINEEHKKAGHLLENLNHRRRAVELSLLGLLRRYDDSEQMPEKTKQVIENQWLLGIFKMWFDKGCPNGYGEWFKD